MPINWFWSKTHQVRCKDGSVRLIHKNIDHALPLSISNSQTDLSANLKGLEQLKGAAKAKYEKKIQGLLYSLNEQNQSLMMSFRSIYIAFQSNPCENDGFLKRETEKLLDEQGKLSDLKIKINALIALASTAPNNIIEINNLFGIIASTLGGAAIAPAASAEIADTRAEAKRLLERK